MCGIVGIVSKYTNGFSGKEADVFRDMLFVDTLRGFDSTGVFGVSNTSNVVVHKDAINGPDFIKTNDFINFRNTGISSGKIMVGHNRAATRGIINAANAHPFYIPITGSDRDPQDHIILVQNGTWKGDHKQIKDTEVDTEVIAHILAEEEDIEKALHKINAAYALVWYNTKTQKLYLVRNDERPLCIAYTEDDGLVFASEINTILWACSRNDLKLKQVPYLIKENHVLDATLDTVTKKVTHISYDVKPRPKSERVSVWMGEWGETHIVQRALTVNQEARNSNVRELVQRRAGNTDAITIPFIEHVRSSLTEDQSSQLMATMNIERVCGIKNLYIELIDFKPINIESECSSWWAYGYAIDPRGPDEGYPDCICYWPVYNKSMEEMVDYVTDSYYTGKQSTRRVESFLDNESIRRWVAMIFITDAKPVEIIENETLPNKELAA